MKKDVKFYTVDKEINGTNYKAQFSGMSVAFDCLDNCYITVDGQRIQSERKVAEFLFKNVIVEPTGLEIDDFESLEEINEVITFAMNVMQGKFREDKSDQRTIKK